MEANVGVYPLAPPGIGVSARVVARMEEKEHGMLVTVVHPLAVGVLVVSIL